MRSDRRRDDRGSTELAIATPLLLFLVLFVVQTAMWMHGDHVAASIAQRTIAAARSAEPAGAQSYGEAIADDLGGSLLTERSILIERSATTTRVVVAGQVTSLIPGFSWPVRHELSAPVERFVPPTPVGAAP